MIYNFYAFQRFQEFKLNTPSPNTNMSDQNLKGQNIVALNEGNEDDTATML